LLLDIEGTTTPIAFVTDTLFPYARARLVSFLSREGRADEASEKVKQAGDNAGHAAQDALES